MMKVNEFVNKAVDIAKNYKTLYVMGCFGSPLNATNKKRFTTNHSYNKKPARTKMINNASSDTFGFDCVCLIKGILWGWNGNKNAVYGGAKYCSNGVPDFGADAMTSSNYTGISSNMATVTSGEVVWMKGHVGIYIGNGEVVECTPAFKNKVQITKLSQRKWLKHGKLKYVDYSVSVTPTPTPTPGATKEFIVRVSISNLNIRSGAGLSYKVNRICPKGAYTIVETKIKDGYEWGRLKSGAGWIALKYTTKI